MSGDTENISRDVADLLFDYGNTLYTSSLSLMEIIYLMKAGKIKLKFKTAESLLDEISNSMNIHILDTKPEHFRVYSKMQLAKGHRDQIDHFIISQSITEKIPLISSDGRFKEYKELDFIYNTR